MFDRFAIAANGASTKFGWRLLTDLGDRRPLSKPWRKLLINTSTSTAAAEQRLNQGLLTLLHLGLDLSLLQLLLLQGQIPVDLPSMIGRGEAMFSGPAKYRRH